MKKIKISGLLALIISVSMITVSGAQAAPTTVSLGAADDFVILSGTPNITDAGNTSAISGYVGLYPASGSGIGLLCSQVSGVIYARDNTGDPCFTVNDPLLLAAKNSLTAAYIDAAARTPVTTVPTELGGTTLVAGVYGSSSTTFEITAGSGALILDGQSDSASVFIFEMDAAGTGLTVGAGSTVTLINGAQACNIFWRVDTATINTGAVFKGNILALNSITVANGANIVGRLLARNGNVTLINDTVTIAVCAGSTAGGITGGPVPGLPNTTSGAKGTSNYQIIFAVATVATLLLSLLSRRKRTD